MARKKNELVEEQVKEPIVEKELEDITERKDAMPEKPPKIITDNKNEWEFCDEESNYEMQHKHYPHILAYPDGTIVNKHAVAFKIKGTNEVFYTSQLYLETGGTLSSAEEVMLPYEVSEEVVMLIKTNYGGFRLAKK